MNCSKCNNHIDVYDAAESTCDHCSIRLCHTCRSLGIPASQIFFRNNANYCVLCLLIKFKKI